MCTCGLEPPSGTSAVGTLSVLCTRSVSSVSWWNISLATETARFSHAKFALVFCVPPQANSLLEERRFLRTRAKACP